MDESFSSSSEWTSNIPHRPTCSFGTHANMGYGNDYSTGYDQFCTNTVNFNTFGVNSIQQTPTDIYSYSGNRCEGPAEDMGFLNIPSIHETMNNSCDFQDFSAEQNSSTSDWEYFGESNECAGDALSLRSGSEPATCVELDEDGPGTSEHVPKEPLKRMRRQRANDRERRRMKSLNGALNNLKRCIPLPKTKRRVTKLEILRLACHYIQTLWDTLNTSNNEETELISRRSATRNQVVNGMTVTQRLSLLSNNLKLNFQL